MSYDDKINILFFFNQVGQILGTKIFLTEIVGFIKLGEYITTRTEGLDGPTISVSYLM